MKKFLIFCVAVFFLNVFRLCHGQTATEVQTGKLPPPTPYKIISRSANSQIWERTIYERGPSGEPVARKHRYTELSPGLNFKNPTTGQWVASKEEIDLLPDGTAAATNGQHQAHFPSDIYNGVIRLVTPDRLQLESQPIGLCYDDGTNTVLIAELTNSVGELINSNQIIYPNAFSGIDADLLYTYRKSGFEQDVIFRQQPPLPAQFGMGINDTKLELMTEFFNAPKPVETATRISAQDKLQDTALTFGTMKMIHGKAFLSGDTENRFNEVSVYKSWININGRSLLVEEVPFLRLSPQLQTLRPAANGSLTSANPLLYRTSTIRLLPPTHLAQAATNIMRIARADLMQPNGLVMDYATVNAETSAITFQGDTTYFVDGDVIIDNVATFEGGTVIKYDGGVNSVIEVDGTPNATAVWETAPYRPAIFTSMNDNSVGDAISGSSGIPTISAGYYLWIDGSYASLPNVTNARFSYADQAVDAVPGCIVRDCQFINCIYGVTIYDSISGGFGNIYNALFSHCTNAISDYANFSPEILTAENVTVDSCGAFFDWQPGSDGSLQASVTNSIFSNTPQIVDPSSMATGLDNGFYNSPTFGSVPVPILSTPFQTVGAGNYYLTNNCGFQGVGTTNIDSTLLADLAQKTTYPPVLYSNRTFLSPMTFSRHASRDNGSTPDLGYHYDPVDYLLGAVCVTNANVTVNPGTVIGCFGLNTLDVEAFGLDVEGGGQFTCHGLANEPNHFVQINSVQEEHPNADWAGPEWPFLLSDFIQNSPTGAVFDFRFTDFSGMAQDDALWQFQNESTVFFRDSEFYGGVCVAESFSGNVGLSVTNCLFDRVQTIFYPQYAWLDNDLIYDGLFYLDPSATNNIFENNLFDVTDPSTLRISGVGAGEGGYNAYYWPPSANYTIFPTDLMLTNAPVFQSGSLGNFYQAPGSPTINAGSTNANLLGFYHYTVTTNQTVEGTNTISIGYHYVATDHNDLPLDSNGDGIPDYIEDPIGNGMPFNGTNWALAINIQPTNQTVIQGTIATLSVTAGGVPPLSYQWYFNSAALANQTNSTLIYNPVETINAGNFFVVVTNNFGALTSSVATLTVLVPPSISITNPANNQIISSNTNITLMVSTSDVDGTVTQVQFFQGTTNLGSVTTAPFNFIWTNAPTGNYTLTAIAIDNYGLVSTSSVVNLFIGPVFATNNLVLWLKASTLGGLTNNASIATWPDSSGWANNATQSSQNQKPFYVTNALNGLSVVQFRGSQFLNIPNFPSGIKQAEGFVVVQATNWPTTGNLWITLWMFGNNHYPSYEEFPFDDGSIHENFGSSGPIDIGVPPFPLTQYNVYEICSQSNNWEAWMNQIVLYQTTNNTVQFISSPQLGNANYGFSFNGNIAEVLVFNRGLSMSERSTVNAYLNSKYALAPPVPATPTNLVAVAISPSQIGLTWNEPFTNSGATQISIERSTSSASGFVGIAQINNALSYIDTNLTAGTTYYYRIRAMNLSIWSPYSTETNATTLVSGVDIPFQSLVMWLKADSGLAQGSTNTPVDLWADQSGNGNSATQPSGGNQPAWVPGVINGLPAVRFNGTSSCMGLPSFSYLSQGEIVAVVKSTPATNYDAPQLWYFGSSGNVFDEEYEASQPIIENFGSSSKYNIGVPTQSLTNYNVYEVSSQRNNWAGWIDGSFIDQLTNNTVSFSSSPNLGGEVINIPGYPTVYFDGDIVEVMLFNRALTDSERATVNNYLDGKYALGSEAPWLQISIVQPTNSTFFAYPANVAINNTNYDAFGSINNVQFFAGTNNLGTVTSPPFNLVWSNAPVGIYPLTAIASDSGITVTSSVVNIIVDAPSVTLTSPTNNSTFPAGTNVFLAANATDAVGSVTQVQFFQGATSLGIVTNAPYNLIWSNPPPDGYNLTVSATDNYGVTSTSSVVHIVVGIAPSVTLNNPAYNSVFIVGSNIALSATASDPDGSITQVQFYHGATSIGTVTSAPYNYVWTNPTAGGYALTAIATDNNGQTATSAVVDVVVDIPPNVALFSPTNGAIISAGSNIGLDASASDADGVVTQIQFFEGNTSLGIEANAPYNLVWSNVTVGSYTLTAQAADNYGIVSTSTVVSITVDSSPTVSITFPTNNAFFFPAFTNVTITATASESGGTIAKVQFFQGAISLGTVTAAPYSLVWSNAPPGNYSLTARATDNNGLMTTSSNVNITVAGVSITSPTNGVVLASPATVSLSAAVVDNATITQVQYFSSTTNVGTSTTAPYNVTWSNVSTNVYSLTAHATDTAGRTLISTPVIVVVDTNPNTTDRDGDGVNDFLEYLEGRNPLIAGSVPDTNGIVNFQVYTPLR